MRFVGLSAHRVDWGGHIHPTLPEGAEIAEDAVSSWGEEGRSDMRLDV